MRHAQLPRSPARFDKAVADRVRGLWAPCPPPYAVIVHRGRRTGAEYRSPVTAVRGDGTLVVPAPYGAGSDWVRNLPATGGEVRRVGRRSRIVRPRVVGSARDEPLPATARAALRHMRVPLADFADR